MNTKDSIMYAALSQFAEKGYEGVSMRDIAAAVGIKAASIYNHYTNKEDIFNSLMSEMDRRYCKMTEVFGVPLDETKAVALYSEISEEVLQTLAEKLFLYFLKDDFAAPFRRMLTAQQFSNSVAGDTFRRMFVDGAIDYQAKIFEQLMHKGAICEGDAYTTALHFYAPIFLILTKYDAKPKLTNEALEHLRSHVKQFSQMYANKGD